MRVSKPAAEDRHKHTLASASVPSPDSFVPGRRCDPCYRTDQTSANWIKWRCL